MTAGPLLYLIAGEPSGDRLGGTLIAALRRERPELRFAGLGGPEMAAAGLAPLFDYRDLAVMGLAEILPRLPTMIRRLRETTRDVLSRQPAALITIDNPGFTLRVAERVRAKAPHITTIHYVAPSVWAWRPERARHMARYIDHVLALLPFEPPYMEAVGMTCDFVGHPVTERPAPDPAAVAALRTGPGPHLLIAPGSRRGEVRRLGPVLREVAQRLRDRDAGLTVTIPVAETVATEVEAMFAPLSPRFLRPEEGPEAKAAAMAAADAAAVASGTVTLEMAAAGTPHVSCYRTSWLTAAMVRRLVKVDTAHLVNLVVGRHTVPECLQEACTPDRVLAALTPLLSGGEAAAAQRSDFRVALAALGADGPPPSTRAARSVLHVMDAPLRRHQTVT
ncbi:MAG: lipid-A-disaccharide synthase [Pseudomonadota bacterium]